MATAQLDLNDIYRRFGEAVFHRARRLMRDDALADDVVQETFLRAHRYQASYQGGSMLSWLFVIADRVAFDAIRKRGVVVDADTAAVALDAYDSDMADSARAINAQERLLRDEHVAAVLSVADDETRQILVYRYVDELNTEAIVARTGQSERTIRRRLQQFFQRARSITDGAVRGDDDAPRNEGSPPCAP
jgi:RNA polymerase sigma-70 factor (ECF subfamily)